MDYTNSKEKKKAVLEDGLKRTECAGQETIRLKKKGGKKGPTEENEEKRISRVEAD